VPDLALRVGGSLRQVRANRAGGGAGGGARQGAPAAAVPAPARRRTPSRPSGRSLALPEGPLPGLLPDVAEERPRADLDLDAFRHEQLDVAEDRAGVDAYLGTRNPRLRTSSTMSPNRLSHLPAAGMVQAPSRRTSAKTVDARVGAGAASRGSAGERSTGSSSVSRSSSALVTAWAAASTRPRAPRRTGAPPRPRRAGAS
jgi:hypothetical protein